MNYRQFPGSPGRGGRPRPVRRANYRAAPGRSRCSVTHAAIWARERTCTWRFTSAEEFVWFFRRWYGPALQAFEVLDQDGRAALAHDLAQLARHWGRNRGGGIAIPATYLETMLTLR